MKPGLRQEKNEDSRKKGGGAEDDQRNHRRGRLAKLPAWVVVSLF